MPISPPYPPSGLARAPVPSLIFLCSIAVAIVNSADPGMASSSAMSGEGAVVFVADAGAQDRGKQGNNKKKKKKKGAHSSVTVGGNGPKVRTANQDGSITVGPNGVGATVRPGGGPVGIGITPSGKPRLNMRLGGR